MEAGDTASRVSINNIHVLCIHVYRQVKTHTKPNVILVSVTRHDKGRQRKVVIVASGGEIELERVCSRLDRNMLTSEETVLRR